MASVAEKAYQATKAPGDPDWAGLQGEYRAELEARADATIKTGIHQTPFETEVLKLHKAEQEETKGDAPLAVGEVREGLSEEEVAEAKAQAENEEASSANQPENASAAEVGEAAAEDSADLHKMKRGELDTVAEAEGLDPSEYSNMTDLIEAIEDKRGEK